MRTRIRHTPTPVVPVIPPVPMPNQVLVLVVEDVVLFDDEAVQLEDPPLDPLHRMSHLVNVRGIAFQDSFDVGLPLPQQQKDLWDPLLPILRGENNNNLLVEYLILEKYLDAKILSLLRRYHPKFPLIPIWKTDSHE